MSNELWNLHCTRSNDEESDFDSVTEWASNYIISLERRLAECQAQTPLTEGPWEEQAYRAGKRDALREAIDCARNAYESGDVLEKLINMAKLN